MSNLRIILTSVVIFAALYGIAALLDPPCWPHCDAYTPVGFMGPPK